MGKMDKNKHRYLVIIIGCVIYLLLLQNHIAGIIFTDTGHFVEASFLYVLAVSLVLYRIMHGDQIKAAKLEMNLPLYTCVTSFSATVMEELLWNDKVYEISLKFFLINFLIILMLTIALVLVFRNTILAYGSVMGVCWLYGVINHYVLEFKGCPPLYGDVMAAKTALTVVGSYHYMLSGSIVSGTLFLFFYLLLLLYCPPQRTISIKSYRGKAAYMIGVASFFSLMGFSFWCIDIETLCQATIDGWMPQNTFQENGAPITFLVSAQNIRMTKPQNYSEKRVEQILSSYQEGIHMDTKPSVIVIMNESFADIGVLGDFQSDEYMAGFNAIDSYVMRGNTYVSVWGGGTCNSEFEFLTGSTMANIKSGIYPYQSYDLSKAYNITDSFKALGYETVAFHPYLAENWNRATVYNHFGFDEFVTLQDMEHVTNVSWCASDQSDYEKVIEIYENRTAPLFLFNVTMQNHGGYTVGLSTHVSRVSIEEQYAKYSDVINYLTLIRESDKSFLNLIDYFSRQPDPVIVCMFGDHQPILDNEFMESMRDDTGKGIVEATEQQYITPYIIWSNYEMETKSVQQDMSLNYLGANLMNLIGIHTAYSEYLLDLQQNIPIINLAGYKTDTGVWNNLLQDNDLLDAYRCVQYYELFDQKIEKY